MTDDFEAQLDQIRVELYEQTKAMSNKDTAHITNENARRIAERYGIRIVQSAKDTTDENAHAI